MQAEVQMYLHILVVLGVIMSTPYIFKVFALLGKLVGMKMFPTTRLSLEYEDINGKHHTKVVQIADTEQLVDILVHSKGEQR
ncbi:hypothetical protein VCHA42O253_20274 [Vibrio chagasii]|nr:hypothetical protein VCHA42O253_20274 [Vibrio chagasii]